ncbi:polysaccharide pyruvyl transferase family protein [Candidatus Bipolaricaulota bacterium]|nr:polysaccharide pyruvyl transferase family protein [Candidatus Bipolaricaulota bacterium]
MQQSKRGGTRLKQVVIAGYYGFENLGDEALRAALSTALREFPDLRPTWLTARPRGANEVNRMHPIALFTALRRSVALFFGGGGLLQNRTSNRSLLYYLFLILFARVLRRPVFLLGQGIGPINGRCARALTRIVLSSVCRIGCRDRQSLAFLRQMGIDGLVDGDLFFLTPPWTRRPEGPREDGVRIVLSLKGSGIDRERTIESFVDLAAGLQDERRVSFTLLPFFPAADRSLAEAIAQRCALPCRIVLPDTVEEASAEIARADLLISSRLHPLEFALRTGTPMFAIVDDPKIERFIEEVKAHCGPCIPYAVSPSVEEVRPLLAVSPEREAFQAVYHKMHAEGKAAVALLLARLDTGRYDAGSDPTDSPTRPPTRPLSGDGYPSRTLLRRGDR